MPFADSRAKRKTVLRTIRIPEEYDDSLRKDARSKGLSVNALLSTIIARQVEWDRFSERYGFISVTTEVLRNLIGAIDQKRLEEMGRRAGSRIPREMMLFWKIKPTIENFPTLLGFVSKYMKIAQYEVENEPGQQTVITARHELGENWSIWLRALLDEALRTSFGIQAEFEISQGFVVARFTPHHM